MAKAKIAIIEDQQEIAEMYRFKFESEGYEVEVANDGASGFIMVQEFKPDLILLDLMMPIKDGPETLDMFFEAGITTPVMILTNLGKEESESRLRHTENVIHYLIKANYTPKEVLAIAVRALNGETF
jgi:DNA-binding response OmpR family regulator